MELTMSMSAFKALDEKELYLLDCGSLAAYAGGALAGYGCMAGGIVVAAGG